MIGEDVGLTPPAGNSGNMNSEVEYAGARAPGVSVGRQPEDAARRPVTLIRPPRGWQMVEVAELWRSRELLYFLIWRDVKVRYKQTLLGAAWAVLQPGLMMVVFTIFFSRLAKVPSADNLPYPIFVYAGLLPWTFFATAVSNAGTSVVNSERLISKIYFPRLAIPFAAVGASLVDFAIAFGLLIGLMIFYGIAPGPQIVLVPVLCFGIMLLALGVGTVLAALNVAYRDFRYVIPFLVQVWMFATPTVYMDPGQVGSRYKNLLALNPMTGLIAAFREACLGGAVDWRQVAVSGLACVMMLVVGCFYFRRVERHFADII